LVIFEILLGILIGPDVLGWTHHDQVIDTLSDLGLSMLIFLAGTRSSSRPSAGTRCGGPRGPG
jgi:Kef-type K+ transport system membrane component KefB